MTSVSMGEGGKNSLTKNGEKIWLGGGGGGTGQTSGKIG